MTMMNVVEATTVTSVHLYDIIRIKHTFAGSVLMDHNNDGIYAEVYDTGFENDGAMWIVESSGTASKYMLRNSATDNYMKVTWIGYRWNVETATKIENDESFYWSVDGQDFKMARLSILPDVEMVKIGMEAQCPVGEMATHEFLHFSLERKTVEDLPLPHCGDVAVPSIPKQKAAPW